MATINCINNRSYPFMTTALTVDPLSSADCCMHMAMNGSHLFCVGCDQSDGSSYKISIGSTIGTNDAFVITSTGARTLPKQPSFLAYLPSNDLNVTGDNTLYTLGTNVALTEVFDEGNNFATNGIFTAPVTGKYMFKASITCAGITLLMTSSALWGMSSNRNFLLQEAGATSLINSLSEFIVSSSWITDMDAGDTAFVCIQIGTTTKTADLIGSSTMQTYFSGFLAF